MCVCAHVCACMHACTGEYMWLHVCERACVSACVHVCAGGWMGRWQSEVRGDEGRKELKKSRVALLPEI